MRNTKIEQFNYKSTERNKWGELNTKRVTKKYNRFLLFFWRQTGSIDIQTLNGCQIDGLTYKDKSLIRKAMEFTDGTEWAEVGILERQADTMKCREQLHRRKMWLYRKEQYGMCNN